MNIGFLMVATNKYTKLWKDTVEELMLHEYGFKNEIHIHLFTDQADEMATWWESKSYSGKLYAHQVSNYVWPEATLLRYKLISDISGEFTEEILIYLDSDMKINSPFLNTLEPIQWRNGIALVSHPGFIRSKGVRRFIDYLDFPRLILVDLRNILKLQIHPGAWESRKGSKAFVPLHKRKTYVHGAIWMGWRRELLSMVELLAENTAEDLESDLIAKWHDESHLNWYAANKEVSILDCTYSGYPSYPWLSRFQSKIDTINKGKIGFSTVGKNDH